MSERSFSVEEVSEATPVPKQPPLRAGGGLLHLHARAVALPLYPKRADPVQATAPPPPHMRALLVACGYRPGSEETEAAVT